jgi:hypothetical protein
MSVSQTIVRAIGGERYDAFSALSAEQGDLSDGMIPNQWV